MFSDAREAADSVVGEAQTDQLLGRHVDLALATATVCPLPRLRCKGKHLVLGLSNFRLTGVLHKITC